MRVCGYRATLLFGLAGVSALTALVGSVAVQTLQRRPQSSAQQGYQNAQPIKISQEAQSLASSQHAGLKEGVVPSVPSSSAESPVEEIPIGIAWEEMRREKAQKVRHIPAESTSACFISLPKMMALL